MESEEWVRAVYMIGFIFFVTSLILNVSVMVIASVLKTSLSIDTGTFALMNIQASGFVAMLYPRIRRWRHRQRALARGVVLGGWMVLCYMFGH